MISDGKILLGKGDRQVFLNPRMANRHGLIAGATGTGKTITLEVLAEGFSDLGVPVFLADVKGDISGMCRAGKMNESLQKRLTKIGVDTFSFKQFPVRFWDVYGQAGHPVRTTISEMGPMLLSRLLGLTDVQQGVLNIVFRIADDRGLLLIDMKDLRAMLQYCSQHTKEFMTDYGTMTSQSLGAIQRALLELENQGGEFFFGEPNLDIFDWIQCDPTGKGYVNILNCVQLFQHPMLYSTFILWLLSELFEQLPEAGDMDKPKMVFFFDEAHLLFNEAPKVLIQKVEQVVKLIRSKGVGVYFITQSPSDLPPTVLAQLSNRVQHALRAYTPNELKAVKAAAQSFRANPAFDTEQAIMDLGVGEALVSCLDEDGKPTIVERAKIICPQSSMSAISDETRQEIIENSSIYGKYDKAIDRQSAYEDLQQIEKAAQQQAYKPWEPTTTAKQPTRPVSAPRTTYTQPRPVTYTQPRRTTYTTRRSSTPFDSVAGSFGREVGRALGRGLLGLLKNMLVFALLLTLPVGVLQAKPKALQKSIVILYENDVHCAIDGYQKLAGLRDAIADTAYVAVVSSGDYVQGGTAGAISRGQYVADIMRTVGYDAITLGNHEFDYPVNYVSGLLQHINAPVVCANFYAMGAKKPVYAPFIIKKFGKTKIAFVGAATPTAFLTETSAFFVNDQQAYHLCEPNCYDVLQQAVNKARKKGAQYVIVLSHLGEDPNQTNVESHGLAANTTGIDIILDGHTHSVVPHDTVLNKAGKPVIITETGTKFLNIGHLLITPDGKMHNELLPMQELTAVNSRVKATTDSVQQLMRELTQRVVCHSDVRLRILDENGKQLVRMGETNLGDLVCDAYRIYADADIALANGGGIRTEKHAGDLTYGDIADILPYDNNLWVVEVTGATIQELLRKNCSFLPVEDGSFPQVSGLRFTARVSDHSVYDIEVLNKQTNEYEPLDLNKTYTIATIDYCVTGGGFYDVLKNAKVVQRFDILYRDVLVEFLEKNLGGNISNDYLEPQGRIKIIDN